MSNQTYYQILELEQTASAEEIKKAYRKLARQYHPDINKASDAEAKMKQINTAYETLNDPQKRADYDRFGSQTYQNPYQQQAGSYQQYGQTYYSMDDFLAAIFAAQFRQQQSQNQQYQRQSYRRPRMVRINFFQMFLWYLMFQFVLRFFFSLF